MYHIVHVLMHAVRDMTRNHDELALRCLGAFVQAGTLDLSLDQLSRHAGVRKRMLVHYFGGREAIEERAMELLETRLRRQFAPDNFRKTLSLQQVLSELWRQTTDPAAKGVLMLTMDLSRRAWNGSTRARQFCLKQQRLWVDLLLHDSPDKQVVEDVLQCFQGAVLAYLVTGKAEPGRRMLHRVCRQLAPEGDTSRTRKSRGNVR
jgi:AcrR family transcriptional regulator